MKTCGIVIALIFGLAVAFAEDLKLETQSNRLIRYAGEWNSTINPESELVESYPTIKMHNVLKNGGLSLQVEVAMYRDGEYVTILLEQISYDAKTDRIVALGQNAQGQCFIGKGRFSNERSLVMRDVDLQGNEYMQVEFEFLTDTDVVVEGFSPEGKSLWKTRYIKANPKSKNIGIQLVSVHDAMQSDVVGTLKQLGRMGYSFVETFVYKDGGFYGMSPVAFRSAVEEAGMGFLGSMTFHDIPDADTDSWDESMSWWARCIEDHIAAGVEYLTTSNHQLKSVETLIELQRYCDYYNAIGKLCREKGLSFAFHNHADEFGFVEGVRIYDYFLENTDPKYVFFQADIYWMDVGGVDAGAYFEKHSARYLSWHVKDYKELGQSGTIDWPELFDEESYPLPQYIVAEVEDYSYPPLFSVQLAWQFLFYELMIDPVDSDF